MNSKNRIAIPGLGSIRPMDKISALKKSYLSDIVAVYKSHPEQFSGAINSLGMGKFETECLLRIRVDFVTLETIFLFAEILNAHMAGIPIEQDYLTEHPLLKKKKEFARIILSQSNLSGEVLRAIGFDIEDIRNVSKTTALDFYTIDQLVIVWLILGIDFKELPTRRSALDQNP